MFFSENRSIYVDITTFPLWSHRARIRTCRTSMGRRDTRRSDQSLHCGQGMAFATAFLPPINRRLP